MADWYWHIHHEVLTEPLTEPLQNRLRFVRANKPQSEVETRLRLIAPVTVELPAALVKARADTDKARAAYDKARAAYDTARAAYVKAQAVSVKARAVSVKAQADALERLHALDCPAALAGTCPWDGKTIFPGGHDV